MSVHVSLHPAIAPAVESAKAAEPSSSAMSFSHALSAASEAEQTQSMQDADAHDADKKPQKKSESLKGASQAALPAQDASVVQPLVSPATVQDAVPVLQVPRQAAEQTVDEQTSEAGTTIASNSSTSGSAGSVVTTSIGLRSVRVASPIISTKQGGSDIAAPATGDDDVSTATVEDGSAPALGAILASSDEKSEPLIESDPTILEITPTVKSAPLKDSLLGQNAPVEKDQPILALGDSAQTAVPVNVPLVVDPPIQSASVSLPGGLDLSPSMTSAQPVVVGVEGRESNSKPVGSASKDRATADAHGRHKTDNQNADLQSSVTSVTAPAKFSVATASSSGQVNGDQSDEKNIQSMQTTQIAMTSPANDAQTTPNAAMTILTSDAPATPVPSANPAATEAFATSTLSGARLIQSVHQSEMKLGMNSAEFGNISISTSVTHQTLSAQISLDHSELGKALAAHLPAMEEKLSGAYGLQARVEVKDVANSSYTDSSRHSNEGHENEQRHSARSTKYSGLTSVVSRSTSTPALETSRLDIRI